MLALLFSFGILGALFVFLAVVSFVNGVLGRFRKISAAQAVRFGAAPEKSAAAKRFVLYRNETLGANVFLGIKDVLSRKMMYATMLAVFAFALFIMLVPRNLHRTLRPAHRHPADRRHTAEGRRHRGGHERRCRRFPFHDADDEEFRGEDGRRIYGTDQDRARRPFGFFRAVFLRQGRGRRKRDRPVRAERRSPRQEGRRLRTADCRRTGTRPRRERHLFGHHQRREDGESELRGRRRRDHVVRRQRGVGGCVERRFESGRVLGALSLRQGIENRRIRLPDFRAYGRRSRHAPLHETSGGERPAFHRRHESARVLEFGNNDAVPDPAAVFGVSGVRGIAAAENSKE